jgi:hypothetical protein
MKNGEGKRAPERLPVVSFLLQVGVYGFLMIAYVLLVLHFLGGALRQLFTTNKVSYAFVALALMVGQALFLQELTAFLLRLFKGLLKRH